MKRLRLAIAARASITTTERELRRVGLSIATLIQALKDGVPASIVKGPCRNKQMWIAGVADLVRRNPIRRASGFDAWVMLERALQAATAAGVTLTLETVRY